MKQAEGREVMVACAHSSSSSSATDDLTWCTRMLQRDSWVPCAHHLVSNSKIRYPTASCQAYWKWHDTQKACKNKCSKMNAIIQFDPNFFLSYTQSNRTDHSSEQLSDATRVHLKQERIQSKTSHST
jgi:hypothetical protein